MATEGTRAPFNSPVLTATAASYADVPALSDADAAAASVAEIKRMRGVCTAQREQQRAWLLDPRKFQSDAVRVHTKKQQTRVLALRAAAPGDLLFAEAPLFALPRNRPVLPVEQIEDVLQTLATGTSMQLLHRCCSSGVRLADMRDAWHMTRPTLGLTFDAHAQQRLCALSQAHGLADGEAADMLTLLVEHTRASTALLSGIALSDVLSPLAMHVRHSCRPNALVVYGPNDEVRVYALRKIAADEEVTYAARPEVMLEHQAVTHIVQLPCEACLRAQDEAKAAETAAAAAAAETTEKNEGKTTDGPTAVDSAMLEKYPAWLSARGLRHSNKNAKRFLLERIQAERPRETRAPVAPVAPAAGADGKVCAECKNVGHTREVKRNLARAVLVSERTHRACACTRCRDEIALMQAAVDAKRAPYFDAQTGDARYTVCTESRRAAISAARLHSFDYLLGHLVRDMDRLVLYGTLNETLCTMALLRWPIARANRVDTCPEFDYAEALDAARAWLWGGELVLYTTPTSGAGERIEAGTVRMVAETLRVLARAVLATFRASPGAPIARLQALGIIAAVYARMPALARMAPPRVDVMRAVHAEPLMRVVLQAEQNRLCRDADGLMTWFNACAQP